MKRLVLTALSAFAILVHPAMATEATKLVVSRVGDTDLSCGQLSQEAALMRDIVFTTEDIKDDNNFTKYGINAAGAIGSFLVGTATGGVGIAAAGYLLKETTDNTGEKADSVQDIAKQRRSLMVGIYNAKGCRGPVDHVFLDAVMEEEELESAFDMAAVEPQAGDEGAVEESPSLHLNP